MTFDFNNVTEVRLSVGAHSSPERGMCFMEMAAWFAGEEHSDRPDCACPVLGAYGIRLNDNMSGEKRNRLLRPLVPLIVGTRDPASEKKRAEFLAMWAVNKIAPIALRGLGFEAGALRCEQARDLSEGNDVARHVAYVVASAADDAADADDSAVHTAITATNYAAAAAAAAYAARDACADADTLAPEYAAAAARDARYVAPASVWPVAVEGLRQAILIGKHEPPTIDWEARHDALKELVA